MSKRDNPRLKATAEASGKNKRAAHSVQKDGRLGASKDYSSKSGRSSKSYGDSKSTRNSRAYDDSRSTRSSRAYGAAKSTRSGKSYDETRSTRSSRAYGEKTSSRSGKPYDDSRATRSSRSYDETKSTRSSRAYDDSRSTRSSRAYGDTSPKRSYSEPSPKRSYNAAAPDRAFEDNPNLIIGRNPVMEAVKSGRSIDKILMQKDAEGSAKKIASMAREKKIVIQYVDKVALDKLAPGRPHQGVAAYAAAKEYVSVDAILKNAQARGEDPLIVILDGLEDPHNLGAVLRSCDGVGAHGVIIPARRAVGLTEIVAKASAGAIEYIPVAKVTNLAQTIEELKEKGLWIAAVDMDGENYSDAKLTGPLALVIGGEGQGVSEIVRKKSDYIVSMPMKGKVNSLNASNAAAIMLYEVDRQRNLNK